MRIVVDRIEGSTAVLEVGDTTVNFPAAALPEGAGEGAVLVFVQDAGSEAATRAAGEARLARLRAASGGDDGGDFEL